VRLDVAKFSFGNRICEQWKHLPGDVVSSSSVNLFKGRLDNLVYLRTIGEFKWVFNFVPDKTIGKVCSCEPVYGYQVHQVHQVNQVNDSLIKRWGHYFR